MTMTSASLAVHNPGIYVCLLCLYFEAVHIYESFGIWLYLHLSSSVIRLPFCYVLTEA
jgi:hypothetical protein